MIVIIFDGILYNFINEFILSFLFMNKYSIFIVSLLLIDEKSMLSMNKDKEINNKNIINIIISILNEKLNISFDAKDVT